MRAIFKLIFIINLCYVISIQSSDNNKAESVECKRASKLLEECFLEPLPPDLDIFLKSSKIPFTEKEINSKCTIFRKGMNCFNNYSKKCLSDEKYKLYESSISGAKLFQSKLCDDKRFQADFLAHKDCFALIKDDWDKCSNDFQNILTDELHNNKIKVTLSGNRFLQFCCSRYAYETCVVTSARYKCLKTSLNFVRYVTKLLANENSFKNCPNYEITLCKGCAQIKINIYLFVIIIIMNLIF